MFEEPSGINLARIFACQERCILTFRVVLLFRNLSLKGRFAKVLCQCWDLSPKFGMFSSFYFLMNGLIYLFLEWDGTEFNNARLRNNWYGKFSYTFWLSWNFFTCGPTPADPANFWAQALSGMWGITTLVFRAMYVGLVASSIIFNMNNSAMIRNVNDLQNRGGTVVMFEADPTKQAIEARYGDWMKIVSAPRSDITAITNLNSFLEEHKAQALLVSDSDAKFVVQNDLACEAVSTEILSSLGAGFISAYSGCRDNIQ